jgi:hypothetical protein
MMNRWRGMPLSEGDSVNIWERHAKRESRRAQLQRLDERLQKFHNEHPYLELLVVAGLSLAVLVVAMSLKYFLEWVGQ